MLQNFLAPEGRKIKENVIRMSPIPEGATDRLVAFQKSK